MMYVSANQKTVSLNLHRYTEDRGPLLPPLGKAYMDGSIKPGHQELIRVSNNYHKFGAYKGSNQDAARTHIGYRDITKNPGNDENMGYWIWSISGMSATEMNRCRVSNNPPVHQFGVLQGGACTNEYKNIMLSDMHGNRTNSVKSMQVTLSLKAS
jgi:hypothetical protein